MSDILRGHGVQVTTTAVVDSEGLIVWHDSRWHWVGINGQRSFEDGYGVGESLIAAFEAEITYVWAAAALRTVLDSNSTTARESVLVSARPLDQDRWSGSRVTVTRRNVSEYTSPGAIVEVVFVGDGPDESRCDRGAEFRFGSALSLVGAALADARVIEEVYMAIAEGACLIGGSDAAVVNLLHDDGDTVINVAAAGPDAAQLLGHRMPVTDCLSGKVLSTGLPIQVFDCQRDDRVWKPAASAGHVGEALCVPLTAPGGAGFGAIAISNLVGGTGLYRGCLNELVRFAHHAGLSLRAAHRLFEAIAINERTADEEAPSPRDVAGGSVAVELEDIFTLWGMNQTEFADYAGVSRQAVGMWRTRIPRRRRALVTELSAATEILRARLPQQRISGFVHQRHAVLGNRALVDFINDPVRPLSGVVLEAIEADADQLRY